MTRKEQLPLALKNQAAALHFPDQTMGHTLSSRMALLWRISQAQGRGPGKRLNRCRPAQLCD